MSPNISNVSKRLKSKQQWICWRTQMRDGKETKLPVDPNTNQMAKTDDPSTWGSVMDAVRAYQSNKQLKGIGFVFTEDDPFVGIDLDDCRDPESEEWEDWALSILEDVDGFREISPSGTGGHIITIGEIPGDRNRKGSVEIYEHTRYFTVTGDIISEDGERTDEVPEIEESQNGLDAVYNEFLVDNDGNSANETEVDVNLSGLDHLELENHGNGPSGTYTNGANLDSLPEEEQKIVKQAKGSKNGYKFTQLWRGNWKEVYPGESHSEADMGFCDMLAFWCSGDPERIDRVFRASGLIRPKWDEQRYSDGSTYGERTIQRAIAKVDDYWDPDHYDKLVSEDEGDNTENNENASEESGDGGNEDSAGGEGNSDGHSDSQDTPPEDNTESESAPKTDQIESDSETTSEEQNASKRRSRRSRSDSPFLPDSDSENETKTISSDNKEENAGRSKDTSANNDPGVDGDVGEEDGSSNTASGENQATRSEATSENSRRRSRGGRNRMADSSEFTPVNVGKHSGASTNSSSESGGESDAGSTPAPVNDSGGFYDKEFEDDDFLDDVLKDDDEESGPDIDQDEAKGIFDDEEGEESAPDSNSESADDAESSSEEETSEDDDIDTSLDPHTSANGRRKIPSAVDAKFQDIKTDLGKLSEEVRGIKVKHKNEYAALKDDNQLLRKELAYYEDVVDQQGQKIDQLSQVVRLMCQHHPDPFFNQVERALRKGEEIPVEDIIEAPQQSPDKSTTDGGNPSGGGDWVGQSQRSKTREERKTSDLGEQEPADDDDGEDIRDRLSRFF